MADKTRVIPSEILMEEYRTLLENRDITALPLVVSGNSMSPFLVHGRDTVYLSRFDGKVEKGDILLYKRDNGSYILHRVFAADKDCYTMVGDGQTYLEKNVRKDQIVAVATAVKRKGRILKKGDFCWEFFRKVWIRLVTARPYMAKSYKYIKKTGKRTK